MPWVIRTPLTQQDLDDTWYRIAIEGGHPLNAERFLRRIDEKAASYASTPLAGTPREELRVGLRSFPVGDYLVFYQPIKGGIEFIRVLHGSRDLPRRLHDVE